MFVFFRNLFVFLFFLNCSRFWNLFGVCKFCSCFILKSELQNTFTFPKIWNTKKCGILKLLAIFKKCFSNLNADVCSYSVLHLYVHPPFCGVVANGSQLWLCCVRGRGIEPCRSRLFRRYFLLSRDRKTTNGRVDGPAQSRVHPVRRASVWCRMRRIGGPGLPYVSLIARPREPSRQGSLRWAGPGALEATA